MYIALFAEEGYNTGWIMREEDSLELRLNG